MARWRRSPKHYRERRPLAEQKLNLPYGSSSTANWATWLKLESDFELHDLRCLARRLYHTITQLSIARICCIPCRFEIRNNTGSIRLRLAVGIGLQYPLNFLCLQCNILPTCCVIIVACSASPEILAWKIGRISTRSIVL
jgi:hypothetical protein